MLRTSAAALIVTVLIAGPVVAQTSGGTNSTPTITNKVIRSNTKPTSMSKQTNTTKTENNAGKPIVHRRLRHPVVYHRGSGLRHLVGSHHTLSSQGHAAAPLTDQRTQSNRSHKTSKVESNTNAQK